VLRTAKWRFRERREPQRRRDLGNQGTIYGRAVRESVADHSRCPGACRTLERFVGDLAAEEIFCLVESVGDAHDGSPFAFFLDPSRPRVD